jgi:flagellar basal-body rod protein FlgC
MYDPGHPDADAAGYVSYPNINVVDEMVNLLNAQRSYEANAAGIDAAKQMALRALEIGRG